MPRVVVATTNAGKAREIASVLADVGVTWELIPRPADAGAVEETGATLLENARLKARALSDATGEMALADDTGLEVDALGGAPGVHSARFAGPAASDADNVELLLDRVARVRRASRTARFRTVCVLRRPDGAELAAEGVVEGVLATEPRGNHGFGYDPVFVPAGGTGRTFGELTPAEKDAISHRGRALRALALAVREARWDAPTDEE